MMVEETVGTANMYHHKTTITNNLNTITNLTKHRTRATYW